MSDLDKRKVVCPLSLSLGVVQNYRVTERPNKDVYESRPVKGTDKYADAFYKILHAPKGEAVEVEINGVTETHTGLGHPEANALKFTHDVGTAARQKAVQMVNEGDIRAPKKNWDKNFGPEGGTSLDTLKTTYPELYNMRTPKEDEEPAEDHIEAFDLDHEVEEGAAVEGLNEPLGDEDFAAIEVEMEEHEETFHVSEEEEGFCPKCGQKLA